MMSSRNTISVGIERMLNCAARLCSSSVLTLANSMSGCFADAAANVGANARHGAHHGAQKSTIAKLWPRMASSNVPSVSSTTVDAAWVLMSVLIGRL
jgi:hypothetical protein